MIVVKKILFIFINIFVVKLLFFNVYGISDNFRFIIDTVGIPEYNAQGKQINEDIYYIYNVFSYGRPSEVYAYSNEQRFKEEWNNGKWVKEDHSFSNSGTRGEYNILGFNYSGGLVYNVYFAVDGIPETTPDRWTYLSINGAYESWSDRSKFKYNEQRDYMKNTHLLFDTINYSNHTINPYNLTEYNISANSIGLNKVMLSTASTWKTNGIVTVKRLDYRGRVFVATLTTKPMAASADIKSVLITNDKYTLEQDKENMSVKLDFGCNAINLNDYARKEHIKKISSSLYIDDVLVSQVEGERVDSIAKSYSLSIDRKKYKEGNDYTLKVTVKSYLYTEFNIDGLLQDEFTKYITIHIKKKPEVPIKEADIKLLEKVNSDYVVKDFIKTNETNLYNSLGITEKGKYICINIKKNIENFDSNKLELYVNNERVKDLQVLKEDERNIYIKLKVNDNFFNSINSWSYLREKYNSYFKVDFNDIGKRIKQPNILRIKYNNCDISKKIDVIDNYLLNANYEFKNGVLNIDSLENNKKLEEWKL